MLHVTDSNGVVAGVSELPQRRGRLASPSLLRGPCPTVQSYHYAEAGIAQLFMLPVTDSSELPSCCG